MAGGSGLTLTMIILAGMAALPSQPASSPATRPSLVLTDAEFGRLVDELSNPRFSAREAATRQLSRLDAMFLPKLAERHRAAVSEEARYRLRYATETIFYQRELAGRCGFIGIRLPQQTVSDMVDPTSGVRCHGIYLIEALKGLPAAQAGLRGSDVIIGLNGEALPASPTTQKFISTITQTPPGTVVHLRVLRPEQPVRKVTLRPDKDEPSPMLGLKLGSPPAGLMGGVRVTEVAAQSTAEKAGLKANDTVPGVNGLSLSTTSDGIGILTDALHSAGPNAPVVVDVQSCREVMLDVTVGRRPAEYISPDDKAEMQARFARWWREQGGQWQPFTDEPPSLIQLAPKPDERRQDRHSIIP